MTTMERVPSAPKHSRPSSTSSFSSNSGPRGGESNDQRYKNMVHGDPVASHYDAQPQPNRSGGGRQKHHVLNEMQFRAASQRKARRAGS